MQKILELYSGAIIAVVYLAQFIGIFSSMLVAVTG